MSSKKAFLLRLHLLPLSPGIITHLIGESRINLLLQLLLDIRVSGQFIYNEGKRRRLPHPAMKEKELRKAFKPDTKKPPTGRMLLLQCFTVLRMQDTRQRGITRGQLFIIQM